MASVNLIPKTILLQRLHKRRLRFWGISFAISAMTAIVPLARELTANYQLSSQRQAMDAASEALQASKQKRDESVNKLSALKREIARAEKLRFKRSWASLLTVVSRELPDGAWIISFATEPARPTVTGSHLSPLARQRLISSRNAAENAEEDYSGLIGKGGPSKLLVEGQALGIEEIFVFVAAVHGLGIFENAVLKSVDEGELEGLPINHFKLECEW